MAVKNPPKTEPKPDLGKCLICEDPIIARDEVNNHCRQGHVVAIDADKGNPLSTTEAKALAEQKATEEKAKAEAAKSAE